VAEQALAAGFGWKARAGGGSALEGGQEPSENGATCQDEGGGHPHEDVAPISGSRAERYQVMLHVDVGTLKEDGEPGMSELDNGTRVSAETSRRIACDSGLVKIARSADGQVIGAGRRTRTVPPAVRRALEARDRGCRFPGCGLRFTDTHHVKHWADGGETTLRNLVLLCKRHHRAVHEGGVRVCIDRTGQVAFFTPRGRALFDAPTLGGRPVVNRFGIGKAVDGDLPLKPYHLSGASRFSRDGNIPWEVEARAWEALDSG
jgi:hypothetical protein